MKMIFSVSLLLFLAACLPVQVDESSHITEEEVVTALQDNGVNLIEAEFKKNIFGSKLGDVKPRTYEVNEKPFFIFEFKSDNDLDKGKNEFAKKTETMDLVSASTFEKRNILIFYVHEQDVNSISVPFIKEIQEALDNIIEG
ncbi:hypothetical protein H9649_10720 [Sporosarcina sp. Sa2YVA2]|uniref:Lipoprotein n=1 Tax=Sporosarcina quadrami TaxID=2762234 RepID=A0ABR8UAJ1_9BACL|nr:hypothetical protein [Sporosarcina quadrami]MBD7985060.1 hypothetical protein [Sporosarcina quadrami]